MFYFKLLFWAQGIQKLIFTVKLNTNIFYDYISSQNVKQYNNISNTLKKTKLDEDLIEIIYSVTKQGFQSR